MGREPRPHEPPPTSPRVPQRHPLRFVWQMSEEGRFTLASDEFVGLIGPQAATWLGRTWQQINSDPGLDPEDQIARAVATRETWSGLTVLWPVDDGAERLKVELSGVPVFDRDRVFRGYRGFGIRRDLARLDALAQQRRSPPTADGIVPPREPSASERPKPVRPEPARPEPAERPPAEDALASDQDVPALSPLECRAFRELLAQAQPTSHGGGCRAPRCGLDLAR